ncbi:4230_t:CDS:2 [Acaulospora morrowiae]|uniref:4230_t:CDS:1 n=1 Tax=Acaulospora morrowiae TaxID=94023 RepID=A0A9N9BX63_9GLOM|nr:4230_t:CDS:2 [Acaulospora morrowiae]
MPIPYSAPDDSNRLIRKQLQHDIQTLLKEVETKQPLLNSEQMAIYNEIIVKALIEFIYSNLQRCIEDPSYLIERGILAPKNDEMDAFNDMILNMFPGKERIYLSADTIGKNISGVYNPSQEALYTTDFLNSLKFGGLPPHELKLKVGAPIILLRNINTTDGLCNGTRLIVRFLQRHIIEAEPITGKLTGQIIFLPRITLSPTVMV